MPFHVLCNERLDIVYMFLFFFVNFGLIHFVFSFYFF